jgi:hypothetical protein
MRVGGPPLDGEAGADIEVAERTQRLRQTGPDSATTAMMAAIRTLDAVIRSADRNDPCSFPLPRSFPPGRRPSDLCCTETLISAKKVSNSGACLRTDSSSLVLTKGANGRHFALLCTIEFPPTLRSPPLK